MPSWLPTVIVLVIASWGAIAQVLQAIAKKAKEKKAAEEAALRATRELGVTIKSPSANPQSFESASGLSAEQKAHTFAQHAAHTKPQQPVQQTTRRTTDQDLAARRREQLEQLKKRRVVAFDPRTGSIQIRTGGQPGQPPVAPGPVQRNVPKKSVTAKRSKQQQVFRSTHQPPPTQPTQYPQRGQQGRRPTRQPIVQPNIVEPTPPVRSISRQPIAQQDAYATSVPKSDVPTLRTKSTGAGANVQDIKDLLGDTQSLRQLFVLKELLDAPVGLRTEPEAGYLAG